MDEKGRKKRERIDISLKKLYKIKVKQKRRKGYGYKYSDVERKAEGESFLKDIVLTPLELPLKRCAAYNQR